MKILAVDDSGLFLHLFEKQLAGIGYKDFVSCTNIRKGLDVLEADFNIGLVFSDFRMATGSGLDFLSWIRYHHDIRIRRMPFIMVSADKKSDLIIDAAKLGISGYLVKPVPIQILQQKMESLFPLENKEQQKPESQNACAPN